MPPTVKRLSRRAIKVTRVDTNEAWGGQNTGRCKAILKRDRTERRDSYFDFGLGAEVAESWAERSSDATSEEVGSVRFRD